MTPRKMMTNSYKVPNAKQSRVSSLSAIASVIALCLAGTAAGQPFPPSLSLGALGNDGLVLTGTGDVQRLGFSVAGIGDFDGDGFDDVAISAHLSDYGQFSSGSVYVLFGNPSALATEVALDQLDGSDGFRLDGIGSSDWTGFSVSGAGDLNGDGLDDLLIGAHLADQVANNAGATYAVFGRASVPAVVKLADLNGSNGFAILGILNGDESGEAVSGIGDFNGDGFDDFAIGADRADPNGSFSGQAYVGFGRASFPAEVELASLDGTNGFTLNGGEANDEAGHSVAGVGDANGDGFEDLLVGAPGADTDESSAGESYLIFGRAESPESIELELLEPEDGIPIRGADFFDLSGTAVGGGGDVNRDGYSDLLIGAYNADAEELRAGLSYLVYGGPVLDQPIELGTLDASSGSTLRGVGMDDHSGWSVASAGDFNGDGFPDLFVGAPDADPVGAASGEAYVVFGSDTLPAAIELADLDGSDGVALLGAMAGDTSGFSVASAGDFNGDGIGDVILGGPEDAGGFVGIAHLVFGRFETGVTLGATAAACPGLVQLRSRGLTPLADVALFRGSGRGSSTVTGGPCAGVLLDLEETVLLQLATADDLGQWLFSAELTDPDACGSSLQLLDLATCLVSNVTQIPVD